MFVLQVCPSVCWTTIVEENLLVVYLFDLLQQLLLLRLYLNFSEQHKQWKESRKQDSSLSRVLQLKISLLLDFIIETKHLLMAAGLVGKDNYETFGI